MHSLPDPDVPFFGMAPFPVRRRNRRRGSVLELEPWQIPGDPKLIGGQFIGPAPMPYQWSEEAHTLEITPAGAQLAALLDELGTDDLLDEELIEVIAASERMKSWATARQAAAINELAQRRAMHHLERNELGVEVSARLAVTNTAAQAMVARAQNLEHAPEVFDALATGSIDSRRADVLIDATITLDHLRARGVHRAVLPGAGHLTWRQIETRAKRAVIEIDGPQADQRHTKARKDRQVLVKADADGMAWLSAYLPADDAITIFTALDQIAGTPTTGDDRAIGARRADALTDLAREVLATGHTPDGNALPTRQGARPHLFITVAQSTLDGDDDNAAHLEGYGPIPASMARAIASQATSSTVTVDPDTGDYTGGADPQRMSPATGHLPHAKPANHDEPDHDTGHGDGKPGGNGEPRDDDPTGATEPTDGTDHVDSSGTPDPSDSTDSTDSTDSSEGSGSGPAQTAPADVERRSETVPPPARTQTDPAPEAHDLTGHRPDPPSEAGMPLRTDAAPAREPVLHPGAAEGLDLANPLDLMRWVSAQPPDGRSPVTLLREELGIIAADSYAPSAELRRLILERDRTCQFPSCAMPSWRGEIDHIIAFDPTLPAWAQTTDLNLSIRCKHHHQLKTRGLWTVHREPKTGTSVWTSTATGHNYRREPDKPIPGLTATEVARALESLLDELPPWERHHQRVSYRAGYLPDRSDGADTLHDIRTAIRERAHRDSPSPTRARDPDSTGPPPTFPDEPTF
ncbi:HNH endonuclease signature motif containing protein [Occultella aeris]|nr:HNH endonuclease signature motif containing protein [Occultella aeris]